MEACELYQPHPLDGSQHSFMISFSNPKKPTVYNFALDYWGKLDVHTASRVAELFHISQWSCVWPGVVPGEELLSNLWLCPF